MIKEPADRIEREIARGDETARAPASAAPSLLVLILLAVGFRLPALFLLRYGGSAPDWSDFQYYHEVAALSAQGYLPGVHFWVEYPPLFPWLAVGAYQLSLLIPGWIHPYFWFDLILSAVMALADAGSIVLVDRLGDAYWGAPAGRRSAMIYTALFLPAFAILGWFDTLPTFFLLLALYAALKPVDRSRSRRILASIVAGVAVGIGAMLKLFPLLALPVAGLRSPSVDVAPAGRDGSSGSLARVLPALVDTVVAGVSAAVTIGLIALPFLVYSRDTFLATFRNVLSRGSWMSPWALLDGYYGTGGVASLHDRLFYNASASWGQPSQMTAVWWAAAALGSALYAWRWWVARRNGTARAAIALTGFAVTLLLLLSRGFSQQFTVWMMPFVAIILPGISGAMLAVLLTLNDLVLEGYLYVTLLPTLHQLLWISVGVRTALLLWFAAECAVALNADAYSRFRLIRRWVLAPAIGGVLVAAVIAFVLAAPHVQAAMLERTGDSQVVAAVEQADASGAVIFTQPDVFDRLAGDLRPRPTLLVAEPRLLTWTGDRSLYRRLETSLDGQAMVILVSDTREPASPLLPAVRAWLGAHYGTAEEVKAGATVLEEFRRDRLPSERAVGVQFGNEITLAGIRPEVLSGKRGSALEVTLDWRADREPAHDYTVSLQLLDAQGKLVAQHDAMPASNMLPTTTWQPGQQVIDAISLPLPAGLAPGGYQLIVVLYDHQTLQRLSVHGAGQSGDHATLGVVNVE